MMKYFLGVLLMVMFFGLGITFAQEKEKSETKSKVQVQEQVKVQVQEQVKVQARDVKADEIPDSAVKVTEEINKICPVSNEESDPEVIYAYQGKTYSLCCNKCLKKFKANPEKYIYRLEKIKPEDQQ